MALDQKLFAGHPRLGSARLHIPENLATGPIRLCAGHFLLRSMPCDSSCHKSLDACPWSLSPRRGPGLPRFSMREDHTALTSEGFQQVIPPGNKESLKRGGGWEVNWGN